MTKFLTLILLTLFMALAAASCGGGTTDPVGRIAAMAEAGKMTDAQREGDRLLADSAVFGSLGVDQLCRLALVFVSIPGDQEENDGNAVKCLNRARMIDNDSLDVFINRLSSENAGHLKTLYRVGAYLEMPREELVSEEDRPATDSLETETHNNE